MLIDSHCHLNYLEPKTDLGSILESAKKHGVSHILNISVTLEEAEEVINTASNHQNVYAAIGVQPSEEVSKEPTVDELLELVTRNKVVAIGECGLDYYYDNIDKKLQLERFMVHIEAAYKSQKPLIIHSRAAQNDTLGLLNSRQNLSGVMHCFTESWEMAKAVLDLGFYISFSGIVTFKNASDLREIVKKVPMDRILLETDAPYLAPTPMRGKQNLPEYLRYTAEAMANLKGVNLPKLADQTSENFFNLFNVK
ncbi:MAG: TatD family hydrolase [Gammaproteobacteria bacterium]|nr:TatD family hydrolase [Gammaproteobacteria bacterium]